MLSSYKVKVNVKMMCVFGTSFQIDDPFQPSNSLMNKYSYLRFKLHISTILCIANVLQNFSDFIMKWAIFEEHSSSCVVYSRFSGTLFPVSMIDGVIDKSSLIIKIVALKYLIFVVLN